MNMDYYDTSSYRSGVSSSSSHASTNPNRNNNNHKQHLNRGGAVQLPSDYRPQSQRQQQQDQYQSQADIMRNNNRHNTNNNANHSSRSIGMGGAMSSIASMMSRKRNSSNISFNSRGSRGSRGSSKEAQHQQKQILQQEQESLDPTFKLARMLNALNEAIFPHDERLSTIAESLYEFDHREKAKHDTELQYGAANIFYQKLAFASGLAYGKTQRPNNTKGQPTAAEAQADHETALICTALEMIHRASDAAIERSFEEIGREILPLITKVINRAFDSDEISTRLLHNLPAVSKDKKIAVQKITKVLAAYSLVPSAKIALAHSKEMLSALVKVIDVSGYNRMLPEGFNSNQLGANGVRESSSGTGLLMTEAARFNAIATLTNLAFAEGNRMRMMSEPGLVLSISLVANSSQSEMARQCAALAIMNLSNGDDDTVPNMTGNEFLLDTLVALMDDPRPETRRNAAVAIYNFANSDENSSLLARYGDGVILEVLVRIIVSHDSAFWNDHARANAAETLFNMSCSTNTATSEGLANHPGLVDSLATVVKEGTSFIDVMMYCTATLRRLAELIFPPSPCHSILLSSLVKSSCWTKTNCIAIALDHQATNIDIRQIMVMHYGLLNALGRLATIQEGEECRKIRAAAISAIEKLSNEDMTRPIMAKNELIMMALTRASYLIDQNADFEDDDGDSLDEEDGERKISSSELVKMALKNLVATM